MENFNDKKCFYCGENAFFVSINSKRYRCKKLINLCPAIIKKANESRKNSGFISKHMEEMKQKAQESIKKIKEIDLEYDKNRGRKGAIKRRENGWYEKEKNGMYNKKHTNTTKENMRISASKRDNTNIGKYERTEEHRKALSLNISERINSGKMFKAFDTIPELLFKSILIKNNIPFKHKFLVRFKEKENQKIFHHNYDFKIDNSKIIFEVDGDYWHSRPEIIERDKYCEHKALEKGYKLFRIKEYDLKNNICEVESIILSILQEHH